MEKKLLPVKYLSELNAFHDWHVTHPVGTTAYALMLALYDLANRERFPDKMALANCILCGRIECSEDSLARARNRLIQAGRIEYSGQKRRTPVYRILYLTVYPQNKAQQNPQDNPQYAGYPGKPLTADYTTGFTADYTTDYPADYPADTMIDIDRDTDTDETYGREVCLTEDDKDVWGERWREMCRGIRPEEKRSFASVFAAIEGLARHGMADDEARKMIETAADGRWEAELAGKALDMTMDRQQRSPLTHPADYMRAILERWRREGITTLKEWRTEFES